MSDVIDNANDHAEQVLNRQIQAAINRPVGVSLFECANCGNPIPEQRRRAVVGCELCIDCQSLFELKNKHYRSV